MTTATAAPVKAEVKTAPKPDAPKLALTKTALTAARKERETAGTTIHELAIKHKVSAAIMRVALEGVNRGGVKPPGTSTPHVRAPRQAIDFAGFAAKDKRINLGTTCWETPGYCLVRADSGRSGVSQGKSVGTLGTPWAMLCIHGNVIGAAKGEPASTFGKTRRTLAVNGKPFCVGCVQGAPGVIPGSTEVKAEKPKPALKVEVKPEVKPKPKAAPRASRTGPAAAAASPAAAAAIRAVADKAAAEATAEAEAKVDDLDTIA